MVIRSSIHSFPFRALLGNTKTRDQIFLKLLVNALYQTPIQKHALELVFCHVVVSNILKKKILALIVPPYYQYTAHANIGMVQTSPKAYSFGYILNPHHILPIVMVTWAPKNIESIPTIPILVPAPNFKTVKSYLLPLLCNN